VENGDSRSLINGAPFIQVQIKKARAIRPLVNSARNDNEGGLCGNTVVYLASSLLR